MANLGQHVHGHAEQLAQPRIPAHIVDVEQHGAAGIRDVGCMHATARERPNQPGVDGAECELSLLSKLARALDVVKDPLHLAG